MTLDDLSFALQHLNSEQIYKPVKSYASSRMTGYPEGKWESSNFRFADHSSRAPFVKSLVMLLKWKVGFAQMGSDSPVFFAAIYRIEGAR